MAVCVVDASAIAIARLLALKRRTDELGLGDPIPEIDHFIDSELRRHGTDFAGQGRPDLPDTADIRDSLNEVFRGAVSEATSRLTAINGNSS